MGRRGDARSATDGEHQTFLGGNDSIAVGFGPPQLTSVQMPACIPGSGVPPGVAVLLLTFSANFSPKKT
jgi:hypothetical protein